MNINSNLINLLRSLAEAAENGGINVDISINVSMDSSSGQTSAPKQKSSETMAPAGDEEQAQILRDADELDDFLYGKSGQTATETRSEGNVQEAEAVPSSSATKSEEPSVAVSKEKEERPARPKKAEVPAAGSNGRCTKMVLQRQKQLMQLGREVPDELLQAPSDEVNAQQMLSQLRPYLVN